MTLPVLRISSSHLSTPSTALGTPLAPVTQWRDVDGAICVEGALHSNGAWVEVRGMGRYVSRPEEEFVIGFPASGVDSDTFNDTFNRSVLPLLVQLKGAQCLHASGVSTPAGLIALCGVSGAGKSTTAAALDRMGYPFTADDAVAFSFNSSGVPTCLRLPFSPRLDRKSRRLIALIPSMERVSGESAVEEQGLAGVVILEKTRSIRPSIERLQPAVAFREILQHAYCFSLHDLKTRRTFSEDYLALAEKVPAFRLAFSHQAEQLSPVLDLLCDRLQTLPPVSRLQAEHGFGVAC